MIIQVLQPVSTAGLSVADVEQLTQSVRDRMLREMEVLTEIARRQGVAMTASQASRQQ